MIHRCNIHCHTMDLEKAESMGIEDRGKWLPFSFLLDITVACKMTSDDEDEMTYNCTTVFTEHGDTYVIDTPYSEFNSLFEMYFDTESSSTDDINL